MKKLASNFGSILFLAFFAAGGCFAGYGAFQMFAEGRYKEVIIACVLSAIFCFVGFGGIWGVLAAPETPAAGAKQPIPSLPIDPATGACEIKGELTKQVGAIWFFAVIWNAISWASVVAGWSQFIDGFSHGKYAVLALLLFPAVGIGLLIYAIRLTSRRMKYGQTRLLIQSSPIPLGGELVGRIPLPANVGGFLQEYELKVQCVEYDKSGDSNSERFPWQDTKTVTTEPDGAIPVQFDIPLDARETFVDSSGSRGIRWQLKVTSLSAGMDFSDCYPLPVYRVEFTPEQREQVEARAAALAEHHEEELQEYVPPSDSGLTIRPAMEGGTEFFFNSGRNSGLAIMLCIFGVVFGLPVVFAWSSDDWSPKLFTLIFGAVGGILIYSGIRTAYGTYRTVIGLGVVRIEQRLFQWGNTRTIPTPAVADIVVTSTASSGDTAYYDIGIKRIDGSHVKAGSLIREKMLAEYFAREMKRCIREDVGETSHS